jgi:hypothetical protein
MILLLAAPAALAGGDSRSHSRKLAAQATTEHAAQPNGTRRVEAKNGGLKKKQAERCAIKPVMTDREIEGCRVSYTYPPSPRN